MYYQEVMKISLITVMIQQLKHMSERFFLKLYQNVYLHEISTNCETGLSEKKLMYSLEVMKLYEITVLIQSV